MPQSLCICRVSQLQLRWTSGSERCPLQSLARMRLLLISGKWHSQKRDRCCAGAQFWTKSCSYNQTTWTYSCRNTGTSHENYKAHQCIISIFLIHQCRWHPSAFSTALPVVYHFWAAQPYTLIPCYLVSESGSCCPCSVIICHFLNSLLPSGNPISSQIH